MLRPAEEFADYAERGRNSPWRYLATLALGLLLSLGAGAALLLPMQMSGLLPADLTKKMVDPRSPVIFFTATGVMFACLLAGFALAAQWLQGKRFADIVGRWRWRLLGLGFAAWALVLVTSVAIDVLLAPHGFTYTASAKTLGLAALAMGALAPQVFAEEFIFRGWITQGLFLAMKRPLPTALVSGLVFGAVHLPNGTPQAVSATIFGILTALLAIRLGGIAFTTGLHLANNLFGAVVVVSANDVFRGLPGVFSQSTPQFLWLDVAVSCVGLTCLTVIALKLLPFRLGGTQRTADGV